MKNGGGVYQGVGKKPWFTRILARQPKLCTYCVLLPDALGVSQGGETLRSDQEEGPPLPRGQQQQQHASAAASSQCLQHLLHSTAASPASPPPPEVTTSPLLALWPDQVSHASSPPASCTTSVALPAHWCTVHLVTLFWLLWISREGSTFLLVLQEHGTLHTARAPFNADTDIFIAASTNTTHILLPLARK